jgi:orotidine-5'-phosphate decarboxylase
MVTSAFMKSELFTLNHGVILSCDVGSLDELKMLTDVTSQVEGIVGYKIGFILGLTCGLSNVVKGVSNYTDSPLIYDHQKAGTDIPQMGAEFAKIMSMTGIPAAIIFPQAGPATEKEFIKALLDNEVVPIVGGHMTHPQYLARDGGFIKDDAPERIYEIGAENGAEYFVVPGNNPSAIENYSNLLSRFIVEPKFCMPGIGRQGGDIVTAFQATRGNPAYAIIGSAIYMAKDMKEAAKRFCEEALKFE